MITRVYGCSVSGHKLQKYIEVAPLPIFHTCASSLASLNWLHVVYKHLQAQFVKCCIACRRDLWHEVLTASVMLVRLRMPSAVVSTVRLK